MAEHERILSPALKPVLFAGNALQLQLDDTESTITANRILVSPYLSSAETSPAPPPPADADAHSDADHAVPPVPRPAFGRVRFRSRVRITSGLRRDRRQHSVESSDASDSPSSSISAPLRYHADESNPRGPLGQRLSVLAANAWQKRRLAGMDPTSRVEDSDERTLLRRGNTPPTYGGANGRGDNASEEDERRTRSQEEIVFGKWPWRLLNRHWWWWQVESTVCCCCSDESDGEE